MTASERLLALDSHHLEGADVLEYPMRVSLYGIGNTFEEACENYLTKISGKKLVFGYGDTRKEVTVL